MWVIQTIFERVENNILKWYEQVVCMVVKRWPKQIMTWPSQDNNKHD